MRTSVCVLVTRNNKPSPGLSHRITDRDTMGDAAICWVKGILPPQPEKIDADGTLFFRDFF
jgi:hypothetical protein